jgi:CHAD domain-containing protein
MAECVAFTLDPGRSIGRELRRIARKELGRAAERLLDGRRNDDDVHEARKSVKKVEALTKLLDAMKIPPPRKDLERLRKAKRSLSRLRDAEAVIETLEHLRSRFSHRIPEHTSTTIRARLEREKSEVMRRARSATGSTVRAAKTLRKIRRGARDWAVPSMKLSGLPRLLGRSFRASRKAMKRAQTRGRPSDFHDWRKRVKDLWYQLRLAERLVAGLTTRIEEFKELETALGEEHNQTVLRARLTRDRGLASRLDKLMSMSVAFEDELQRAALVLGTRLHKLSPKDFARDLRQRLRPKGARRRKPAPRTRGLAVA